MNCSFIWLQAFCTFWLEVDLMYKLLLQPFAETEVRCKMQVLVLGSGFQISAMSLPESWQDYWFCDHGCKKVWNACDPAARVWNSLVCSRAVYSLGAGKLWCGLGTISNFPSVFHLLIWQTEVSKQTLNISKESHLLFLGQSFGF